MTTRKKILLAVILIPLSIAVLLFFLFMRTVKVPSGAMQNTILIGDRVFVSRSAQEIKRGDLIIFKHPKDPSVQYIERVIGLPGETIEIRDTKIFINDKELAERRLMVDDSAGDFPQRPLKELSSQGAGPYSVYYRANRLEVEFFSEDAPFAMNKSFQIPQGHYFVLGDNRDDSQDSRYWGTVPQELITGKALAVYWSAGEDPSGHHRIRWNRLFTKLK